MSPEVTVPLEMVDYTIDFLHNDNVSLKSCSLVSRSCRSSAQYHLFRRLVLHRQDSRSFEAFAAFSSTPSNLLFHVQELILHGGHGNNFDQPVDCGLLYHTVQRLPNLRRLLLHNVSLYQPAPFLIQSTAAPLHPLEKFILSSVLSCDEDILCLVASFSSIGELQILEANPNPPMPPNPSDPPLQWFPSVAISSIIAEGGNLGVLPKLLFNPMSLQSPTVSLDIGCPFPELPTHLNTIEECLQTAGPFLRHVRLDISSICCLNISSSESRCNSP